MPTSGGLVNRVTVGSPPRNGGALQPIRVVPLATTTNAASVFEAQTTDAKRGRKTRFVSQPQVRPLFLRRCAGRS